MIYSEGRKSHIKAQLNLSFPIDFALVLNQEKWQVFPAPEDISHDGGNFCFTGCQGPTDLLKTLIFISSFSRWKQFQSGAIV